MKKVEQVKVVKPNPIKLKVVAFKQTTNHRFRVAEHLAETVSLGLVAGFSIYQALHDSKLNLIFSKALLLAGIIIALRAGYEFVNHLDGKA